ncbi:DUF3159 domain-containing protein [soil metagenome]
MQETAIESRPVDVLMARLGGVSGIVSSTLPVLAFVSLFSAFGLTAALTAALILAAAILVYRLLRRERLVTAVAGFGGVAVAAAMSLATGEGRDFYLLSIWTALALCAVCVVSVLVRRPLVGYVWAWGSGADDRWRRYAGAHTAFAYATLCWAAVFGARFVVKQYLYVANETTWLGVARIGMGLPLTAVAVVISLWAIRSARAALPTA